MLHPQARAVPLYVMENGDEMGSAAVALPDDFNPDDERKQREAVKIADKQERNGATDAAAAKAVEALPGERGDIAIAALKPLASTEGAA